MTDVKFFFDPRCPWCYQTSKWAKRLAEVGELTLDWGVFSLQVVNLEQGKDPMELEESGGSPQLRTAVLVGDTYGTREIGRFYTELGRRTFDAAEPSPDQDAVIRDSLGAAGMDVGLYEQAMADPGTWKSVVEDTLAIFERVGDVGVPTIVLDGGEGPAIFGPVVVEQPTDEDAVELWRHVEWLTRYDNFAELKRKRKGPPDLPLMKWYAAQRAKKAAEEKPGS